MKKNRSWASYSFGYFRRKVIKFCEVEIIAQRICPFNLNDEKK